MIENKDKDIEQVNPTKKVWTKPKLLSGKEIGFFGLGNVQTGNPSSDFSQTIAIAIFITFFVFDLRKAF